ncbi:ferric-chelate reductase [Schizosaccharomyces cryophilus OY26]|uniref:ferric-chelate reductase (NADPH) n=1 Tax=Schizosaccharomyces cryophilus (strain OY26 / ATCC MYA-4695 / CBS 11777 / NBRC 106824 / NRRL Y48691) TaxID=653667 RepID=S9W1W7_SCHCR|nr:ferric-chelate reductase [Schizosaccharomyces cryophilus OY26]EPY52324.1 ferric-chelate reductase [Schizosaccharomyces cryophilus OY26]
MTISIHDRWTVGAIILIISLYFIFVLFFSIEYVRAYRKSNSFQKTLDCQITEGVREKIYLSIRNVYGYLLTHKSLLNVLMYIFVILVSIPFVGLQTRNEISPKDWNLIGIAARLGFLASGLFFISFFFSLKNNPFSLMLFSSHEKMNYLHRQLSVIALFIGIIHGILFVVWSARNFKPLLTDRITLYGYAIGCLIIVIFVSSLPYYRKRYYEFFFAIHHFCSAGFIILIWRHHPASIKYMRLCMFMYLFDRCCRIFRSILNRCQFESFIIDDDLIYMKAQKPKHSLFSLPWAAGNHIYINIPFLSYWQVHPFTMVNVPTDDCIELIVVVRSGFTKRLADYLQSANCANLESNQDYVALQVSKFRNYSTIIEPERQRNIDCLIHLPSNNSHMSLTALVDGPYGPISNPCTIYSYVLLISGGVGVSYSMPILRDLLTRKSRAISIKFVWSCRSVKLLELLYRILEYSLHQIHIKLEIICHLTSSIPHRELSTLSSKQFGHSRLEIIDERPDFNLYIKRFAEEVKNQTSCLAACGSNTLLKTVKSSVTGNLSSTSDIFQHYEEL